MLSALKMISVSYVSSLQISKLVTFADKKLKPVSEIRLFTEVGLYAALFCVLFDTLLFSQRHLRNYVLLFPLDI